MNDHTDQQLLRDYVERRSDAAFTELVRRHVDLVHSAAFRLTGEMHAAKDVTQTVFMALAQNAARLTHHPVLSGWLHTTARNLAAKNVRAAVRRQNHESEAAAMNQLLPPANDATWEEIAPHLDAALGELNESERDIVLLRYFERKSAPEMADLLGISNEAAQKRVSRAVERLRAYFNQRGVTVGTSGLTIVISANAVQAAPAGLAVTISAATLAGAAVASATIVAAATKTIAMTTLQKTLVTATVAVLAGVGIYEARQVAQLRNQVQTLQKQLAARPLARPTESATEPVARNEPDPPVVVSANQQNDSMNWTEQLLALNAADWRQAFALGQRLAALPPNTGLAVLQANWNSVTNDSARQQILKAFQFAAHQRLPAVLELGLNDHSPEVQSWALNYLKDVALQDFTTDYSAAKNWLAAHRESTLAAAISDAVWQVATSLRDLSGNQLLAQLGLINGAKQYLAKFPEALTASGLDQILGDIAHGKDPRAAAQALKAANGLPLSADWLREVALPLLSQSQPWEVTEAAAAALGRSGSEWALQPLLDTLTESVYAANRHSSFTLPASIAELKSPKAIPTMIALIEADNTYGTIYGIGYFGLGKLTGVAYDEKHDGAWWRQWWENNKQRFPADVRAMEIPKLAPIARKQSH